MLGTTGEQLAAQYLTQHGYEILETNWRCEAGEADLIAVHDGDLVVVEVKTRRGAQAISHALLAISPAKAQRLLDITQLYYAQLENEALGMRVDVVAVAFHKGQINLQLMRNAVGEW